MNAIIYDRGKNLALFANLYAGVSLRGGRWGFSPSTPLILLINLYRVSRQILSNHPPTSP